MTPYQFMNHCYVKFRAASCDDLSRTRRSFDLLAKMKSGEQSIDEAVLTALLTEKDVSYFSNFTAEERREWNEHWRKTPVAIRISAAMITPQWDLESMYQALWNGEYALIGIFEEDGWSYLAFEPHAYPFGGTSCMVAFVECFGHTVAGIEDGTGYREYERQPVWRPSTPA